MKQTSLDEFGQVWTSLDKFGQVSRIVASPDFILTSVEVKKITIQVKNWCFFGI